MSRIFDRLRRHPEQAADGLPPADGHPARAPEGSLWAEAEDVDFFVPPALSLDTLDYLSPNGVPPDKALRERFGLPADEPVQEEASPEEFSELPAHGGSSEDEPGMRSSGN